MNMKIEDIASKHLGKAGDGTVVKPYVTPESVDPTLLVGVPRDLNRVQYGITDKIFTGFDLWNCYEVSCLTEYGQPVNAVIRLKYPADSTVIVESKSLKLYLNSFNLMVMGKTFDSAIIALDQQIRQDFETVLGLDIELQIHGLIGKDTCQHRSRILDWTNLDEYVDAAQSNGAVVMPNAGEDPSLIKSTATDRTEKQLFHSYSLRSNCRVTNQPDWGDVFIYFKSNHVLDPVALYQYIVSMRRENHFHEEICEAIYKRLYDHSDFDNLLVACLYTRRGGIDINPVRYKNFDPTVGQIMTDLHLDVYSTNLKTERQ